MSSKRRFYRIFDAIEYRTRQLEENVLPIRPSKGSCLPYPSVSRARTEMCDMYALLKEKGILRLFDSVNDQNYPASGCKTVGPALLEMITGIRMAALTPNRAKTPFLFAGILLATIEEASSLYTGIPLSELVFGSLVFAIVDRIFANGSFFEMFIKLIWPGYSKKILQHEAGHFLAAYLLGCPVEGCVLSSFAAMNDYRFGGPFTSVSAGTSFFDPVLSDQVNNMKPLSRSIIDRFSVVAMAGKSDLHIDGNRSSVVSLGNSAEL